MKKKRGEIKFQYDADCTEMRKKICVENSVFRHSVSVGKSLSHFCGQLRSFSQIVNVPSFAYNPLIFSYTQHHNVHAYGGYGRLLYHQLIKDGSEVCLLSADQTHPDGGVSLSIASTCTQSAAAVEPHLT